MPHALSEQVVPFCILDPVHLANLTSPNFLAETLARVACLSTPFPFTSLELCSRQSWVLRPPASLTASQGLPVLQGLPPPPRSFPCHLEKKAPSFEWLNIQTL